MYLDINHLILLSKQTIALHMVFLFLTWNQNSPKHETWKCVVYMRNKLSNRSEYIGIREIIGTMTQVFWTTPEFPSSRGRDDQDAQLIGSGGKLFSCPCVKTHPARNQGPDNASIWSRTRGGRLRDTEALRDPRRSNPLEAYRDLGAGRGRQRGERIITGNVGRHRHAVRGAGTSGRVWWVTGAGNVQVGGALQHERRWVAG